jgi:chromosome segregation ATPase
MANSGFEKAQVASLRRGLCNISEATTKLDKTLSDIWRQQVDASKKMANQRTEINRLTRKAKRDAETLEKKQAELIDARAEVAAIRRELEEAKESEERAVELADEAMAELLSFKLALHPVAGEFEGWEMDFSEEDSEAEGGAVVLASGDAGEVANIANGGSGNNSGAGANAEGCENLAEKIPSYHNAE